MSLDIIGKLRDIIGTLTAIVGRVPRRIRLATGALVTMLALATAVGLAVTSSPTFLGGYHNFEENLASLQTSEHSDVACGQCHTDERGPLVYRIALVGDFYRGLFGKPDKPAFVDLAKPSAKACLECHREDWSENAERTTRVPHPAHLRVSSETRDCVECHKWTGHEEESLEEHKTKPFSAVCASFDCHAGTKPADSCGDCHHAVVEEQGEWQLVHSETVQLSGPNACLEVCHDADQCRQCHTTGVRPDFPVEGYSTAVQAIEREHVKQDWMEHHGTWALEDEAKCFVCHVSVSECESCHAERPAFHGLKATWLNRHKEFVEDERSCLACHEKPWCEDCHAEFEEMR